MIASPVIVSCVGDIGVRGHLGRRQSGDHAAGDGPASVGRLPRLA